MSKVTLEIPGFHYSLQMHTHGEDELLSRMLLKDKIWEAFETQLVIGSLKTGNTFIDIGANLGYYTLIASKCVGEQGKVFAFEPEHSNFTLLQKNINTNRLENVQLFQAGLGNQQGNIDFYINNENRGDHRAFNHDKNREKCTVDILIGDDVLDKQSVDFIKIDTQGYELGILQGLRKTIANNQEDLKMIIEFWPFALKQNGHSANALLDELSRYDFSMYIIDHIKHELAETDIARLKDFTKTSLTDKSQGFVNLFLK